ncbi:MAG: four helix bundle protein [Candidatus Peregrinibacteria bacterium]|nr:four helix bundle protein [Candidatus Peregrinibacteria bacterium]
MDRRSTTGGFRKLIAWQEAKTLALSIYKLTEKFPTKEQFHLVSQLRRAASSVMANLAEGSAMPTKAHRLSYYARARGSAVEVDNHLELSLGLHYITQEEFDQAEGQLAKVTFLITRLLQS